MLVASFFARRSATASVELILEARLCCSASFSAGRNANVSVEHVFAA